MEWKRIYYQGAVLSDFVLGNFLSGMETRALLEKKREVQSLGNFLSGMETETAWNRGFLRSPLETSLVEWKHGLDVYHGNKPTALETSLVEWKQGRYFLVAACFFALETSLVEWKQGKNGIFREGGTVPWKLP